MPKTFVLGLSSSSSSSPHSLTNNKQRLLENGHTETEIVSAAIAAAKTRKERIDTIHEIKQKYKALVAAGIFEKVNDIDQKQQPPQQKQQYVSSTLSPIPTMNRSTGLTPSPIISRKRSPMRLIVSGPSPSTMTTTQLAQLRLPSSPEDQQQQHRGGRGGGGSSSSFISPRCQIQRKRSAPTMMMDTVGIDDIFGYSSDAAAIRSDPFSYTPARVCTPKYDVCSSPRSLLVSSSSITSSSTVMMMRTPPPAAGGGGRGESSSLSSSPVGKEKRPPIQPRRLASTPPPPKVAALYQQSFAPSRSM